MRSAGTNAALPSPPFLRQGSQAWDTYRDSAMMWDLRTCSQPQGSFQVWEQQQNCSSASPQGALAGHVLRMDGSREELAVHSSGRFSVQVSGSTHMSQVPCPGCHTSQPHRAPLASSAPPWSQGRCSGHKQHNTLRTLSPAQLGLSTHQGWAQPSSCKCGFASCRQTWYKVPPEPQLQPQSASTTPSESSLQEKTKAGNNARGCRVPVGLRRTPGSAAGEAEPAGSQITQEGVSGGR